MSLFAPFRDPVLAQGQIEAIRPISPPLAGALMSLAANYDYERILSLLAG